MAELNSLIETLHNERCSLVLADKRENIRLFRKKGVRDLEDLLDHEPATLHGATIADKVVGKAAAGMMVYGGVGEVYADVLSQKAIPLLRAAGVKYSFGQIVDRIIIPEGDQRCPLEQIVEPAETAAEVVSLLRRHFAEMKAGRK